jgi:hypothetical protein
MSRSIVAAFVGGLLLVVGLFAFVGNPFAEQHLSEQQPEVLPSELAVPAPIQLEFAPTTDLLSGNNFCWKDSSTRSPKAKVCPSGKENIAGLCYTKCKSGYSGGLLCKPGGWKLIGSYSRGTGTLPGCASGDELSLALCYGKCPSGMTGVGPVCWGNPPKGWVKCGMGAATTSAVCAQVTSNQVGGVFKMVGNVATLGVASAGTNTAAAAKLAADSAQKAADAVKQAESMVKKGQDMVNQVKKVQAAAGQLQSCGESIHSASKKPDMGKATSAVQNCQGVFKALKTDPKASPAPASGGVDATAIARQAAMVAGTMDPTGITAAAAQFTYPKCSAI